MANDYNEAAGGKDKEDDSDEEFDSWEDDDSLNFNADPEASAKAGV